MTKDANHVAKTAQIWRAGGMIWMISITMFFAIYDLYVARLPVFLTAAMGGVAFAVTFIFIRLEPENITACEKTTR